MNCWQAIKKVILHSHLNAQRETKHREFQTTSFGLVHCKVHKSRNLKGGKLLTIPLLSMQLTFFIRNCLLTENYFGEKESLTEDLKQSPNHFYSI
jgi:hypothetical protein